MQRTLRIMVGGLALTRLAGATASDDVVAPARTGEQVVITTTREAELGRTDGDRPVAADQRLMLDGEDLQGPGILGMADLARDDPRLTIIEDRTHGGISDIRMRGLGGNRVLVTLDCAPLADDLAGRGYVDLNLLTGMAATFGPGSLRGGSDAIAGALDFRSLAPDDLVGPNESLFLGRVFGSTLDGTVGLHARAATAGTSVGGLLAATIQRRHEREAVGDAIIAPQTVDVRSGLGSLQIDLTPHWRTTWTLDIYDEHAVSEISDTAALKQDDDDHRRRWRAAMRSQQQLAEERTLRLRAAFQQTRSEEVSDSDDFFVSGIGFNRHSSAKNTFSQNQITAGADLAAGAATSGLSVFGADLRLTRSRDLQTTHTTTQAPATTISGQPTRSFPLSSSANGGLSYEGRIVLPDPHWALEGGARLDGYALDVAVDDAYNASLAGQNAPSDLTAVAPTGRLAALWSPHSDQVIYLKGASGYRNGRFDEANQAFTNFTNGYTISPNPELRPERSMGLELGGRQSGPVSFELTGHATFYRDFIETAYVGTVPNSVGIGPFPTLAQYQAINIAAVEIHGIDAQQRAELGAGLFEHTSVGWVAGRDYDSDQGLRDLDPLRAVAGLGWHGLSDTLTIECVVRGAATRTGYDDPTAYQPPGWVVADLHVSWRPCHGAALDVAWINLFNKTYWRWSDVASVRTTSSFADRDYYAAEPSHLTCSFTAWW